MKEISDRALKNHTTFRIGGPAGRIILPESESELGDFLKNNKRKFMVLGGGSNILFLDKGFTGTVIKTSRLNKVEIKGTRLRAEPGVNLAKLIKLTAAAGLSGLEGLSGIPGTLGGAVAGNAGANGETIGDRVEFVKIFTSRGERRVLKKKALRFSYRKSNIHGVICGVGLKLKKAPRSGRGRAPAFLKEKIKHFAKLRLKTQPWGNAGAGSIFKNPPGQKAGRLIEAAGLKGVGVGGALISEKHANFIINKGNAKAKDVLALIKKVQKKVKKLYNIQLEPEIIIIEQRKKA